MVDPEATLMLSHEGNASLCLEWPGGIVHFDPKAPPPEGAISVLTWNEQERLQGVVAAIAQGQSRRVVAAEPLLEWLGEHGPLEALTPPIDLGMVKLEAQSYKPIPYATPTEGYFKLRSAVLQPSRAIDRLKRRFSTPRTEPWITLLTFPDGRRLLHLNCALHRWTERRWLRGILEQHAQVDWLIVGVDYGEADAVRKRVGQFAAKEIFVADLVFDVRRRLELPEEPLVTLVEGLRADGFRARGLMPMQRYDLNHLI